MAKIPGKGTILQVEIASVYTTIANRVEISGPSAEMGEFDVSDLDSSVLQTVATMLDPGELTMKVWYDPNLAGHIQLNTDLAAGTVRNYKLKYADGLTTNAQAVFPAFVKKFERNGMKLLEYVGADLVLRVTGTITNTAGS
jgi:hypothetical protein